MAELHAFVDVGSIARPTDLAARCDGITDLGA